MADLTHTLEGIAALLGKYRYLCLSRAPLSERLALLRQIAIADPASLNWRRDVDELERARLADLRGEVLGAIKASDIEHIDALAAEVNAGPWQSPTEELKQRLAAASTAVHQANAIAELRALAPQARAAFASMSYADCREVFARWGKIVKAAKVPVPPELRDEILPLAHWLDEQEERREREREFRAACAALGAAIDGGAGAEELKLLYRQVVSFEIDVPDDLSAAYRRRLEAARAEMQTDKRRQYALAAALVLAVVIALGALAWVILAGGKR